MNLRLRSPWTILSLLVMGVVSAWSAFNLSTPEQPPTADARQALEMAGQWGDKFGALNTLFTGLAFAGLLATLWHERKNSEDREAEHRELVRAMKRQADAGTLSAIVSATRALLASLDVDVGRYKEGTYGFQEIDAARRRLREQLAQLAERNQF